MTAYLHYDVFTSQPFEGNQLAIFPDARGMSAELMQALAREMNFSESTFLLPAEVAGTDIRMRIFTPGGEVGNFAASNYSGDWHFSSLQDD